MLLLIKEPLPVPSVPSPIPPTPTPPTKPKPKPQPVKKARPEAKTQDESPGTTVVPHAQSDVTLTVSTSTEQLTAPVSAPAASSPPSRTAAPTPGSVRAPRAVPASMRPGSPPTTSKASGSKRPPRKLEGWPPSEDVEGAMCVLACVHTASTDWFYRWAYAREWHAQTQGTKDDFAKHYREIPENEKNVRGMIRQPSHDLD